MRDEQRESTLGPKALRALAAARAATTGEAPLGARRDRGGRALALVPVAVAFVLGGLLLPRAVEPTDVPVPTVDIAAVAAATARDEDAARRAKKVPLPIDVRAVGSRLRELNRLQHADGDEAAILRARDGLLAARDVALAMPEGADLLFALRAAQLELFLSSVSAWKRAGSEPEDLVELGGAFLRRLRSAGWASERALVLDETELRVAFKAMWNGALELDRHRAFELDRHEERVLFRLYITHPHPAEPSRARLEAMARGATTKEACAEVERARAAASEEWRAEKIRAYAEKDPTYPASYALGVAFYRAGRFAAAEAAFERYLGETRDGPYVLRARNYLLATRRETTAR